MNSKLQETMWGAGGDRLTVARKEARKQSTIVAHSMMLSAYISVLAGRPTAAKSGYYTLLALYHAAVLLRGWRQLDHNQLDVLVQFFLKIRSRVPFVKSGMPLNVYYWYPQPSLVLLRLAERELQLARGSGAKPHQLALSHMTYAETVYGVNFRHSVITDNVKAALALEGEISGEDDKLLGLRQFVRILRKAGELYGKGGMGVVRSEARPLLERALALARGEANTEDQAQQIERILAQI